VIKLEVRIIINVGLLILDDGLEIRDKGVWRWGLWIWKSPLLPPLEKGENKRGICVATPTFQSEQGANLCNDKQSWRFAATNRIGKASFATTNKIVVAEFTLQWKSSFRACSEKKLNLCLGRI
jgi:hypothetical protein